MPDARMGAFLRELAQADEAAAAVLMELDELAAETERIRNGVSEAAAVLERAPEEAKRAEDAVADAESELAERLRSREAAEADLRRAESGRDAKAVAAARRAATRARDLARMAERRRDAAQREREEIMDRAHAAERDAGELRRAAAELAARLRERPRLAAGAGEEPGEGLAGMGRWATNARAALFVARGQLAAQREAVIRQANELGAAVLGEPLAAQSAASVARRVERAGDD